MAKSLPFATQDNQYPFSYLRMGQLGYNSPGVVLAGDMQVSPGTGLQVQISAGEAYVQQTVARLGSFYAQRGVYQIFDDLVDNPYNTITAPVTYPRVDQVIARVYDSYEQQLSGSSYWRYEWLPGTETSGASLTNLNGAATLPDNSLRLAYCLATTSMSSWSSDNILNVGVASTNLVVVKAPNDGVTDATSQIQATINRLCAQGGGTLIFPAGKYLCSSPLTIPVGKNGYPAPMVWRGVGSGRPNDNSLTEFIYSGTGTTPFIECVYGQWSCEDISFSYSSSSFTGNFVQLGNSVYTGSATYSFKRCEFGNYSLTSAAVLLKLYQCVQTLIEECFFHGGTEQIEGAVPTATNSWANNISVRHCNFQKYSTVAITRMHGQAWEIDNNVFEPTSSNSAAAIIDIPSADVSGGGICQGASITNNWMGDATTGGGTFVVINNCEGLLIGSNFMDNSSNTNGHGIDINGGFNINVFNNAIRCTTGGIAVDITATIDGMTIIGNSLLGPTPIGAPGGVWGGIIFAGNYTGSSDPTTSLQMAGGPLYLPLLNTTRQNTTGLWVTQGVPSNTQGSDGDICFNSNSSGGGTGGYALYQKRSGSWVALTTT